MTEAQIQKLNDRELLVRTYGKVERIEEKLEIYTNRVNNIEKKQNGFVTKKSFKWLIGVFGSIITGTVVVLKILGRW